MWRALYCELSCKAHSDFLIIKYFRSVGTHVQPVGSNCDCIT